MKELRFGVATEMSCIQGENLFHVVGQHGRGELGIMNLHAAYLVLCREPLPARVDLKGIGKKRRLGFQES